MKSETEGISGNPILILEVGATTPFETETADSQRQHNWPLVTRSQEHFIFCLFIFCFCLLLMIQYGIEPEKLGITRDQKPLVQFLITNNAVVLRNLCPPRNSFFLFFDYGPYSGRFGFLSPLCHCQLCCSGNKFPRGARCRTVTDRNNAETFLFAKY